MLVRKQIRLDDVELKVDGEKGTFEGYASRFGGVDTYGDTIMAGAYASTLRANGKPKMFFNHDWTMPIGRYTKCAEDDSGLYVAGELTPGLSLSADVHAALKHKTLDGLSVGGFVKPGDAEDKSDGVGQIIHKFTRLVEISPCTFPADNGARIDLATVRGEDISDVIGEIETIREFERLLRDAGGFSKGAAAALVARAKVVFGAGEPQTKQADASMLALLERLNQVAGVSTQQ